MKKYLFLSVISISLFFGAFSVASAQVVPVLTATLSSSGPASKSIEPLAQFIEVAKITITATNGDIFLDGIYIGTDIPGGLSNFSDIRLYTSAKTSSWVGTYPNQSETPNLIKFRTAKIAIGKSKTYRLVASLSDTAAGKIRVGFTGFTFSTSIKPTIVNVPIYGNTMTFVDCTGKYIPSTTPTPTPTPVTTPEFTLLEPCLATGLKEGDMISAQDSSDPDIYIVNEFGYKRLFLNPAIFGFYDHLGGFWNVKNVTATERDSMPTSSLFRNCETNDPKVYGIEVTGEDTGILHWVNTSGSQAVSDDPNFFKKVFCINSAEFNWYSQGSAYTSVSQVPAYSR